MKKGLLFFVGLLFAQVIFCQVIDPKNEDWLKDIIPEKYLLSFCSDEPVVEEKDPEKKIDPSKIEPAGTNEETTVQADEYCVSILKKCEGRLLCVAEVDPILEKRIRKRAGNISDSLDEKIKGLMSGLQIKIVKVSHTKIQFRLNDRLGQSVYKRDLVKAGPQLFSSPVINTRKFSKTAVENFQNQKTLTNKVKAVSSLLNSFSITISPDYKSR